MKALYKLIKGLCIILWFRIKNDPEPEPVDTFVEKVQQAVIVNTYRFSIFNSIIQTEKYNPNTGLWEFYKDFYEGKHYESILR